MNQDNPTLRNYPSVIPSAITQYNIVSARKLLDDGTLNHIRDSGGNDDLSQSIFLDLSKQSHVKSEIEVLEAMMLDFVENDAELLALKEIPNWGRNEHEQYEEMLAVRANALLGSNPIFSAYRINHDSNTRNLEDLTSDTEFDCEQMAWLESRLMQIGADHYFSDVEHAGWKQPSEYFVVSGATQFDRHSDRSKYASEPYNHAWIESALTGNIIEATVQPDQNPYRWSVVTEQSFDYTVAGFPRMVVDKEGNLSHYSTTNPAIDEIARELLNRKRLDKVFRDDWEPLSEMSELITGDYKDSFFHDNNIREAAYNLVYLKQNVDNPAIPFGDKNSLTALQQVLPNTLQENSNIESFLYNPTYVYSRDDSPLSDSEWVEAIIALESPNDSHALNSLYEQVNRALENDSAIDVDEFKEILEHEANMSNVSVANHYRSCDEQDECMWKLNLEYNVGGDALPDYKIPVSLPFVETKDKISIDDTKPLDTPDVVTSINSEVIISK